MAEFEHKDITGAVIAAAVAVHTALGPGFVESVYERALLVELKARGIQHVSQQLVRVAYRGVEVGAHRLDLVIADEVVVELKAVADISSTHRAQLTSYLQATRLRVGLLLNFGQPTLQIRRIQRSPRQER